MSLLVKRIVPFHPIVQYGNDLTMLNYVNFKTGFWLPPLALHHARITSRQTNQPKTVETSGRFYYSGISNVCEDPDPTEFILTNVSKHRKFVLFAPSGSGKTYLVENWSRKDVVVMDADWYVKWPDDIMKRIQNESFRSRFALYCMGVIVYMLSTCRQSCCVLFNAPPIIIELCKVMNNSFTNYAPYYPILRFKPEHNGTTRDIPMLTMNMGSWVPARFSRIANLLGLTKPVWELRYKIAPALFAILHYIPKQYHERYSLEQEYGKYKVIVETVSGKYTVNTSGHFVNLCLYYLCPRMYNSDQCYYCGDVATTLGVLIANLKYGVLSDEPAQQFVSWHTPLEYLAGMYSIFTILGAVNKLYPGLVTMNIYKVRLLMQLFRIIIRKMREANKSRIRYHRARDTPFVNDQRFIDFPR